MAHESMAPDMIPPVPRPPRPQPPAPNPAPDPAPPRLPDRLAAGQRLAVGGTLTPHNGKVRLVLQDDGNLVLYRNDTGAALWSSHTHGKPVDHAIMQADGNFVCYDGSGKAYWASGTHGHPGAYVILQDDANLVVYSASGSPLWASNTVHDWSPFGYDTDDVHLDTGEWMRSWASMASTGLISGHTHIWCTIDLRGFHGSVFPVLLDADDKVVWPPNPEVAKHQYGVDGAWVGTHDRTVYWSNQADAAAVAKARSLALIQFLDPKNMLLRDLNILGKVIGEVLPLIEKFLG